MKPILVFQSDFTYKEGAVAAMYGVVKTVDPTLEIFTATHEIPHFDSWSASYRLYQVMRFWPKGTIFVSVVDPGVGTARKAAVALTKDGYYIVTPDNGTLTHAAEFHGIATVREIDETVNKLNTGSSVFHGRDVFAYTAARLAAGIIDYAGVGKEYAVADIVKYPLPEARWENGRLSGFFEIADPNFGNLWSSIPADYMARAGFALGETVNVEIRHGDESALCTRACLCTTFGEVEKSAPVVYVNELRRLGFALREDNAMAKLGIGFGSDWEITISKI